MLLPIIVFKNSFNDVRLCKDYFLFFLTALSLMWFKPRIRPAAGLLLILAWFAIDNFYSANVIQQTTYVTALLLLFSSMAGLNKKILTTFFRITLLIQVLFFITQSFGTNFYNMERPILKVVGSLGQETLSAALIACLIPFTLTKRWLWLGILGTLCILLTTSAMALISLVCALIAMFFGRKGLIWIAGLGIASICAALLFDIEFLANKDRFGVWVAALNQFSQWDLSDILFGRGFGYFADNFKYVSQYGKFVHAHNDYLEVLWSLGLVGSLVFWSALCWPLVFSSIYWKNRAFASSVVAILINATGNFTFFIAPIALIFVINYSIVITREET